MTPRPTRAHPPPLPLHIHERWPRPPPHRPRPPRAAPTPRGRATASADQRERRTRAAPRGTSTYHRAAGRLGLTCATVRLLEGTPGLWRPRGAAAPQTRADLRVALRSGASSQASPLASLPFPCGD